MTAACASHRGRRGDRRRSERESSPRGSLLGHRNAGANARSSTRTALDRTGAAELRRPLAHGVEADVGTEARRNAVAVVADLELERAVDLDAHAAVTRLRVAGGGGSGLLRGRVGGAPPPGRG